MIQDIITNLVKSQIGAFFSSGDIPQEKQDGVVEAASDAIFHGLRTQANSNPQGFTEIVRLLGNRAGLESNPTVSSISSSFIDTITRQCGISKGAASSLASGLIPNVISSLVRMVGGENEHGLNLDTAIGALTGGKTVGHDLRSILDQNGDGNVDSNDLVGWGKHLFSKLFGGK